MALTGGFLLSMSPFAQGQELSSPYEAVRPLGMGGAFTAVANDQNSVWTNPAGIARIRKARSRKKLHLLSVPNMIAGGNSEGRQFYEKIRGAQASFGADDAQAVLEDLDGIESQPLWARAASNPVVFLDFPKGSPWGVGPFTNTRLKVLVDSSSSSEPNKTALIENVSDIGVLLGFAWSNRTNRINIGANIRPISRYDFYDKVEVGTLLDKAELKQKIKSESNVGRGIGADIGLMWTFADFWFPTLGIAVRNLPTGCVKDYLNSFEEVRQTVCGTKFNGTVNNLESPALVDPTDVRVGLSILPRFQHLSRKVSIRFAFDVHNIYIPIEDRYYGLTGVSPLRQIHAGAEMFFGNPLVLNNFSVRAGFAQGFLSAGFSLRFWGVALDYATYGQNISDSDSPKEDRRNLLNISIEF